MENALYQYNIRTFEITIKLKLGLNFFQSASSAWNILIIKIVIFYSIIDNFNDE